MPSGTACTKDAVEKNLDRHLVKRSPAMIYSTIVLCYHLRDPGLDRFRRTECNDEGHTTVGLAIHRQRPVMSFDDCLRDTEAQSVPTCLWS
jgi:hypothetical protein